MKILVTGANGFIGSNLCQLLFNQRHEVIGFDKNLNGFKCGINKWAVQGNCLNVNQINTTIGELEPEAIVHLAAVSVATECDKNPYFAMENNINGLRNVLVSARENKVRRMIFISSSFVYGNFQYIPCDELHGTNPLEVYGGTKISGEYLTKTFCNLFGIEWVIIRPSAVYGYGDKNHRVVQVLLENAIQGKPLVLNGAEEKMDFTCVDDTVDGIARACVSENAIGQVFNITRGEGRSLNELAEIIKGLVPSVKIQKAEMNGFRPKRGALDISKARSLLGYNPKWGLEEGIKKYYERLTK
ncbi:MAG: NAD(P)-dependent oxidoreductase [Patescibacteria group bacterium]|jgi:nucleoside-diphosphate-sugar epimerase